MKLKKLLYWTIFAFVVYHVFGYVKMHTNPDVLAYKRFADAVFEGDDYVVRDLTTGSVADKIAQSQVRRKAQYRDNAIIFTYYDVVSRQVGPEGKSVILKVDQVSRVNPPYYDTLWGEVEVRVQQRVQLLLKDGEWVVTSFTDPVIKL